MLSSIVHLSSTSNISAELSALFVRTISNAQEGSMVEEKKRPDPEILMSVAGSLEKTG
jgi:hypothetical protein